MSDASPAAKNLFVKIMFALALLLSVRVHALSGRFGMYASEGPGTWFQGRMNVLGTDLGIHLAGSNIELYVGQYNGTIKETDPNGFPRYRTAPLLSGNVVAQFYEWGLVLARPIHSAELWKVSLSTGLLGGLLDNTRDESMRPLARTMILVPVFVEGDLFPIRAYKRLGLTLGLGGVWTTPAEEDNLYPEVSSMRWQLRTGLVF